MADNGMKRFYVVAGVVFGTALGVAAAVYLMGQPAAERRERIAEAAERLKQQAERLAAEAKTRARDVVAGHKDRLAQAVEIGRRTAEDKREELHRRLRESG